MPVPHDYYDYPDHGHHPHLHNRHNHAPYIEPDWQANLAKDQLPELSTVGRGPRGAGLYVGNVNQKEGSLSFHIFSDLTGESIAEIGPFPTGVIDVYDSPEHTPIAGEFTQFWIKYNVYDETSRKIVTKTKELQVPPGATGSLIYLYPNVLDRTRDDTYQVNESDLRIYNKQRYSKKPAVRVNDIVFLQTHKRHPRTNERAAWDEYYLTFGTVEAVENGKVVFTSRVFYPMNAHVSWDDVENKPEFAEVAFTGDYNDLVNKPEGIYHYIGTVETFEDLPNDADNGDVYHVNQAHGDTPAGTNYAWSVSEDRWDALGGDIDLSNLAEKEYVDNQDTATFDAAKQYTDNAIEQIHAITSWDDITDKPDFAEVAFTGSFNNLSDTPQDHLRRVYITQEEYDALEEYDPYVIYVTDGEGGGGGGHTSDVVWVAEELEISNAIDAVISGRN